MSGSAKKKGGDKDEDRMTKVVFIYDRMAMLLREMLTLSMLAERFKLARKISAANLSSQTRDMASSYNFQKNSFHCNSDSMTKFLRNLKKKKKDINYLGCLLFRQWFGREIHFICLGKRPQIKIIFGVDARWNIYVELKHFQKMTL
jgi:hypothetical protein